MAKRNRKLSKKEQKALLKKKPELEVPKNQPVKNTVNKKIQLSQVVTIRDLSQILNKPVTEIISELLANGITTTINESIDFDTASIIADNLGFKTEQLNQIVKERSKKTFAEDDTNLKPRSPVVVILGHVDHGKTTLLDKIRRSDIAAQESGGITQHIGAYQVVWKDKEKKLRYITFIDTPGHEAFSSMRAHGANITDIAILVVAADDGVKPQTKEAISHAKAAQIPIIVAINKIDKPGADIEKVKRQLADLEILAEDWGGSNVMVPVSAKTGKGVNDLLDMIMVVSDMEELKANPSKPAKGVVIESHMQKGIGPLATVLIQEGTLKNKEVMVVGDTFGKIKRLENFRGEIIENAQPATPVRVAGLKNAPNFGDILEVVSNEKEAFAKLRSKQIRQKYFGLSNMSEKIKSGEIKSLNIIIKADTQGSLEAIKNSLTAINKNIEINIIHSGVGDINESDINLAISTHSVAVGFRIKITSAAKNLATTHKIKISTYEIIYKLIDDIASAISGLLKPKIVEVITGKLRVLKVFRATDKHKIVGGVVIGGKIERNNAVKIMRTDSIIGKGVVSTLEQNKLPVESVAINLECGLGIDTKDDIKKHDIISAFIKEEQ